MSNAAISLIAISFLYPYFGIKFKTFIEFDMRLSIFFLVLCYFLNSISAQEIQFKKIVPSQNTLTPMGTLNDFYIDKNYNYFFLDSEQGKIWVYDSNSVLIKEIPSAPDNSLFERPVSMEYVNNEFVILDADKKKIIFYNQANNTKTNEFGSGSLQFGGFDNPTDMTIDPYSNIFVIDPSSNRVIKFNYSGLFRGEEKINNPIAIESDIEGKIHILTRDREGSFAILVFRSDLRERKKIAISNVQMPSDISVNNYGEYFITDTELGKIFKYSPDGNIIGNSIGIKSNSKGSGQFSEPIKVSNSFINNEIEMVYVMDNRFKYIQSFDLVSRYNRDKLYLRPEDVIITLKSEFSGFPFTKFFVHNNTFFYVKEDLSVVVREDEKSLYVIPGTLFKNISVLTVFEENIYLADSEQNQIFIFSYEDGRYKTSFGTEGDGNGELNNPMDLLFDKQGLLYIANYGNNRIDIFDKQGNFISKINATGNSLLLNPIDLSLSEDNKLFILLENDPYLFQYDIITESLSQIRLPFKDNENKPNKITAIGENQIAVNNSLNNKISIFEDYVFLTQFLSKGNDKCQMNVISGLYYNNDENYFLISDNDQKIIKTFKLDLSSEQSLQIVINDLGYSELRWEKPAPDETIKIYRKKIGDENFEYVNESKDTIFVLFDNSEVIYDYAIKITSSSGSESEYSNEVRDEFSYSKSIKEELPLVAIDFLTKIKPLNETIVNNQMLSIYRKMVDKYKAQKKYSDALNVLTTMQSLRSQDYTFYIEKSDIYREMHNYKEGIAELKTAIDNFPNNITLYYNLIEIINLSGDYNQVISTCNEAISKFPGDEKIISNMALAYKNLQRYNEATNYYRMLSQQFGKEQYFLEAGNIFIAQNKFEEALGVYNEIKNSGNATGDVYCAIAELKIEQKKYEEALTELNQGLEIQNDNPKIHFLIGVVYSEQNLNNKAIESFQRAVELRNTEVQYLTALADEFLKTNKKEDATFYYESAILLSPENVDVLVKLGSLYLEQGKVDFSYRYLSQALKLSPDSQEINTVFENAASKREEVNRNREPIEFNYIEIGDLSYSLLEFYKNNPFGSVTIFNTKNTSYSNIVIEIDCPTLQNTLSFITIDKLEPNEFKEKYFNLDIKDDLFSKIPSSTSMVEITFTVRYETSMGAKELSKTEKIEIK